MPENLDNVPANAAIIIEDLMDEVKDNSNVTALFTKLAHKKPYFVIYTMQNLFFQSKVARNRSLNCQYVVLFKNPRDIVQIKVLGSQMYPDKKGFLRRVLMMRLRR